MNIDYLKKFYEDNKKVFDDWNLNIKSVEDLKEFIEDTIVSNFQFDFNLDIDTKELFNESKNNDLVM